MSYLLFTAGSSGVVRRVSQNLVLRQGIASRSQQLRGGMPRFWPISFAKAPNGYIYMASGVDDVVKWDGVKGSAISVGLTAPTTGVTIATSGTGEITGRYTAFIRFMDEDGNVSNFSPISNEVNVTDISTFTYTSIPVPDEQKVTRLQILRNTAGQAGTYYVDIDSTDLSATSYTSTKSDATLRTQLAVPLFDSNDRTFANRHGVPRDDKPLIAYYNSRLFMAGEVIYEEGHVEVTNGSATVTGIGTDWTTSMDGRFLYVVGEDNVYEVDSVDAVAQTITLTANYRGTTDKFAQYALRSGPTQRTKIYWTEAGQYDSWPAINSLEIASSDDLEEDITGLVSSRSYLFILQRRHIYRLSFLLEPLVDGGVFLSARRGCINSRCWVHADGWTYMLDDRGIYRFDGSDDTQPLSSRIQDLFWSNHEEGGFRINYESSRFFHAMHDRNEGTIRWFVSLSGERLPRHALCFNYNNPQWWIEEYAWPIGASDAIKSVEDIPILSGPPRQIYAVGFDTLDSVSPDDGDTRGLVASATYTSITAKAGLTLPVSNTDAAPVAIVDGRGKGQTRVISSISGQRINVTRPWTTLPDSTSTFQIGAIKWRWRSGWFEWHFRERNQQRRLMVAFEPVANDNQFDLRYYKDYGTVPINHKVKHPRTNAESDGVQTEVDEPDAEVKLTQVRGFGQIPIPSWTPQYTWRQDLISVELRGFSGRDPVRIYGVVVEGAGDTAGGRGGRG